VSYPYVVAIGLLTLGLYVTIAHRNLFKKLVGLTLLQTGIILFFLALAVKRGATLPIALPGLVDPRAYMNPLPHALMLTAIVVMVATAGVAFAILIRLHAVYATLEEDLLGQRLADEGPDEGAG
jgi:multicomponent Na+:H+ antiporter subunit C